MDMTMTGMGESACFAPEDTFIAPPPIMNAKSNDVYARSKKNKLFEEFFILSGIPDSKGKWTGEIMYQFPNVDF